jgi:hypothetical protein
MQPVVTDRKEILARDTLANSRSTFLQLQGPHALTIVEFYSIEALCELYNTVNPKAVIAWVSMPSSPSIPS